MGERRGWIWLGRPMECESPIILTKGLRVVGRDAMSELD